ncbi:MAG TPA: hypothetical protein VNX02_13825 [Steroidobacteraceae bacterium]|nr:hypothetical protein [Steroidobacteraceae bacterium]
MTLHLPRTLLLLTATLTACGGGGHSTAQLTSPPPPPPPPPSSTHTDVTTYKNDLARTGQNLTETSLTLTNVSASSFGLLRILATDGKVDAQPLYLSALSVGGTSHNVAFVASENDTVYAYDTDTGTALWQKSMLGAAEMPSDDHSCSQVTPSIGVTATPVIDRSAGAHGALFVVAMSLDASQNYHQRLHALDVTTGAELFGGPAEIAAVYPAAGGGSNSFAAGDYEERAGLLLLNGVIYTTWTSHCDDSPYTGWVIAYSETTLAQTAVLNVAPNSAGGGPSIWMAGGGPAADSSGNIYLLTANGVFDTTLNASGFPNQGDYGNSFLKISTAGGGLSVVDYFAMYNEVAESNADTDLGSGGALLLPDGTDSGGTTRHLAVGAGKDGNLYVVNRDSMGKFNPTNNNQIWQQLSGALGGGIWSTPAYFDGSVYYGPVGGALLAFRVSKAMLGGAPSSQSATSFGYPGTAPAISANGTANGIVWAHENAGSGAAVLHAYAASNLATELYNSTQAPNSRDSFGSGNKFITPAIADGKVLVGTTSGVAVFGLL